MSRLHNDANVLCLGARTICKRRAINIINTFMNTNFLGGKYQRRLEKF
jgi:ribose 5-phosphate isomerase B